MTARRPIHPTVFERPHHQRIASVLQGLDGELLRTHACSFGGGTAIALRAHGGAQRLRQRLGA